MLRYAEEDQLDRVLSGIAELVAHDFPELPHEYAELFLQLAHQCLLRRLTGLHLTARKLPLQRMRLLRRPLPDENQSVPLHNCRDHLYHAVTLEHRMCLACIPSD